MRTNSFNVKTKMINGNRVWYGRISYYDDNHKRHQITTGMFATEKKASAYCREYLNAKEQNIDPNNSPENKTILELLKEYQQSIYNSEINSSGNKATTKFYNWYNVNAVVQLTPATILNKKWKQFTVEDAEDWARSIATAKKDDGTNYSNNRVNALLSVIGIKKGFMKYLLDEGYFRGIHKGDYPDYNLAIKNFRKKKEVGNRAFYYISEDDFKRFIEKGCCHSKPDKKDHDKCILKLSNEDYRYRCMFTLSFYTGMRITEVKSLRWKDINQQDKLIHVVNNESLKVLKDDKEKYYSDPSMHTPKTKAGQRFVPMLPEAVSAIKAYKDYLKSKGDQIINDNYVFPAPNGHVLGLNAPYEYFKKSCKKAGLNEKLTVHDLRRSCCHYMCYKLKLPKVSALDLFGWNDVALINDVYGVQDELEKGKSIRDSLYNLIERDNN